MDTDEADEHRSEIDRQAPRGRLQRTARGIVVGCGLGLLAGILLMAWLRRGALPAISMADLEAAEKRWNEAGPGSYDMDLKFSGVNPSEIHIEVRNRAVVDMKMNERPTKRHLWDEYSVPGLFGVIRRDIEVCLSAESKANLERDQNAEPIVPRGVFDAQYGYPEQYHRVTSNANDARWRVTKFETR
jgi:hypothetical protein